MLVLFFLYSGAQFSHVYVTGGLAFLCFTGDKKKYEDAVMEKIQGLSGIERVIANSPAAGAHVIDDHLF